MAAESCSVVDDGLYLIALCNGRNADGLPDEEYAAELQLQEVIVSSAMLQEVIVSSAMAAAALPLLPASCVPPAGTSYEATVGTGECSSSTSPIPTLAPATDNDDHATAAMEALEEYAAEHQLQEVIMSSAMAAAALPLLPASCAPPAGTSYEATVGPGECSSSTSPIPPLAPATEHATAATLLECFPSSAGPSTIPATFLFCKICMDAVPPSDAHSASRGCGHAFCATCLTGYIFVKIQERIANVRCPEDGCGSILDPELCQGMLPGEAFEAWCAVMCESMLLGATKVYCPFKDCSAMMVDDVGGDIAESECPSCKRLFCARCGVPWHTGVRCAEYEQLAVGDRGKEDLVVMEMAMGEKWKRCPQCKFLVQKSEGCLHITCRCGFEFCYGCGKQWGDSHSSCSAA